MWHVWGRRELHALFWWENLMDRDHVEEKCKLEGVKWVNFGQDRNKWRATVNAVMNLSVR
jgi:hypothetical protein